MNRKLIVSIILMLLCTPAIPLTGMAEENKMIDGESITTINNIMGDFLDQYQNSTAAGGWGIYNNSWFAQSFTPTLNVLTRIQLCLRTKGYPNDESIVFSIRESLTEADLTSITLTRDELPPDNNYVWIEVDFKDIVVTPNVLYYMVCVGTAGNEDDDYRWGSDMVNPYEYGEGWRSLNQGITWEIPEDPYNKTDFAFRTYGFMNNPPNAPTITGEINGDIQTLYDYNIQTIDPEQDNVQYFIDWGDSTNSGWIGPYTSGKVVNISHSWDSKGTYNVKVKAKDTSSAKESDWTILIVTMPCSYDKSMPQILELFFQRFPLMFRLLLELIG